MGIFCRCTPDAQPWMSRTAETQRDPRVISLIPAGERPAHSSSASQSPGDRNEGPRPGWLGEALSLTQTLHLQT
jgi:hypothetical protein